MLWHLCMIFWISDDDICYGDLQYICLDEFCVIERYDIGLDA